MKEKDELGGLPDTEWICTRKLKGSRREHATRIKKVHSCALLLIAECAIVSKTELPFFPTSEIGNSPTTTKKKKKKKFGENQREYSACQKQIL